MRREWLSLVVTIVVTAAAAACGGDGGDDHLPDAGPTFDAGSMPTTPRLGALEVIERSGFVGYSTVTARFFQGEEPRYHAVVAQEGSCTLLRYGAASCDPACANGFCTATNVCTPYATYRSAGKLTVTGLAAPLQITPDAFGGYYSQGEALPADLFADSATVTASLAGAGVVPAHTLTTAGVAPIDSVQIVNDEITLEDGQDTTILWTPTGGDERVRLTLNANNVGHGFPFAAIITCDVSDSAGQITVPKALIGMFPATYRWEVCAGNDCPPSEFLRYRAAYANVTDGHVAQTVGHARMTYVLHEVP